MGWSFGGTQGQLLNWAAIAVVVGLMCAVGGALPGDIAFRFMLTVGCRMALRYDAAQVLEGLLPAKGSQDQVAAYRHSSTSSTSSSAYAARD